MTSDRPYYANTFYGIPFAPGEREAFATSAHRAIREIRAEIGITDITEEPHRMTSADGRMGGPVPHANHPAGWYRTMDRGFAVGHFGFPALPRRGERHTARDGSVWQFDLTGTDWWELAEYAPQQDPACHIAELEEQVRLLREVNAQWESGDQRTKDSQFIAEMSRELDSTHARIAELEAMGYADAEENRS